MVIRNLHVANVASHKPETNPPLIVDPDTELAESHRKDLIMGKLYIGVRYSAQPFARETQGHPDSEKREKA